MKKILKRIIAGVLAGVMMLSSVVSSYADNKIDEDVKDNIFTLANESEIKNLILIHNHGKFNENDVFSYGSKIPAYEYNGKSFEKIETFKLYPIYKNKNLIGVIRETIYNGVSYFSYSEEYVNEIKNFTKRNNEYNLIYEENCIYINSTSEKNKIENFYEAREIKNISENSFDFCVSTNDKNLKYTSMNETKVNLDMSGFKNVSSYSFELKSSSMPITKSLSVPCYDQGNYGICWACCTWSIGNYYSSIEYTDPLTLIDDICEDERGTVDETLYLNTLFYNGKPYTQSRNYLSTYYDIDTTKHSSVLPFSYAVSFLNQNKPIYMDLPDTAKGGHHMVMCGYGATSSSYYVQVMDPAIGNYRTMQLINGTCSIQYSATLGPYTWKNSLTID